MPHSAQIVLHQTQPDTLQTTGAFVGPQKVEEEPRGNVQSYVLRLEQAATVDGALLAQTSFLGAASYNKGHCLAGCGRGTGAAVAHRSFILWGLVSFFNCCPRSLQWGSRIAGARPGISWRSFNDFGTAVPNIDGSDWRVLVGLVT
jgi:hypothetical protein